MKNNDYDLVFLDIRMPRMSGLEIMNKIKSAKPLPHMIVITGYEDTDVASQVREMGADYVVKPIALSNVKEWVKVPLEAKGKYWEKGKD